MCAFVFTNMDDDKQGAGLIERLEAAFASAHKSLAILSCQYQ